MEKPAGTIGDQVADSSHAESQTAPKRLAGRFFFPSGSTPLAGFTIKRGIGTGGFGEVYYATSDGGKEVALKYIQRNLDVELRGVRQCLNLKHPNLLALFDIRHDESEHAWVVMEYVAGESLKEVIERHPNGLPESQVRELFSAIGQGVQYLHDHGIVHRDLKPSNLFLDQGTVKIGDYGLSKFISCSRRSGHTESVGTFHYMAPEIGQGRYGREIDVYALGVVLHELLTGRVPFDGESSQEIIMKHLTAQPNLNPVRSPYKEVLAKALAKRPEDRYPSVLHMLVDLGLAQASPDLLDSQSSGMAPSSHPLSDQRPAGQPYDIAAGATSASQIPDGSPVADVSRTLAHAADTPTHYYPPQPVYPPVSGNLAGFDELARTGAPIPMEIVGQQVWSGDRAWPAVVVPSAGRVGPVDDAAQRDVARPESSAPGSVFPEPLRWVLLIATVLLVITRAKWLLPIALTLGTIYGFYLLFSVLLDLTFGNPDSESSSTSTTPAAPSLLPTKRQVTADTERQLEPLRNLLSAKSGLQRMLELHGSMIIGAVVCGVLSFAMTVLSNQQLGVRWVDWMPHFVWLALPSLLGTWALLAIGKFWESDELDPSMRRFCQTLIGLMLGGFAGWLSIYLRVEPQPLINVESLIGDRLPALLYPSRNHPTPYAYALNFAALFAVVRWWRRTDPLRTHRLSLWSTLSPPLAAVLLCLAFPVPQGFLMATTMTVALQLAAPWMNERQRVAGMIGHPPGTQP